MVVSLDKFLLFGDSLTQLSHDQSLGFAHGSALLSDYQRKLDVVVRGFAGYNTEHALRLFPQILEAEHRPGKTEVKIVVIFFGTNDASERKSQFVPLEKYEDNLKTLVGWAHEKNIKVILIGPGLRDSRMRVDADFGNNQRARLWGRKAAGVAQELNVPFIDMFDVMQKDGGFKEEDLVQGNHPVLSKHLDDGIHYSARSRMLLYNSIKQAVRTHYPELDSNKLPDLFPYYQDIDPNRVDDFLA